MLQQLLCNMGTERKEARKSESEGEGERARVKATRGGRERGRDGGSQGERAPTGPLLEALHKLPVLRSPSARRFLASLLSFAHEVKTRGWNKSPVHAQHCNALVPGSWHHQHAIF